MFKKLVLVVAVLGMHFYSLKSLFISGVFVHSKLSSLVLSLSTESANRSVLEIYNSYQFDKQNVDKSKTPNCMDSNNSRYYVDFDYPYSIFLAFATLCAVEAYQQA